MHSTLLTRVLVFQDAAILINNIFHSPHSDLQSYSNVPRMTFPPTSCLTSPQQQHSRHYFPWSSFVAQKSISDTTCHEFWRKSIALSLLIRFRLPLKNHSLTPLKNYKENTFSCITLRILQSYLKFYNKWELHTTTNIFSSIMNLYLYIEYEHLSFVAEFARNFMEFPESRIAMSHQVNDP